MLSRLRARGRVAEVVWGVVLVGVIGAVFAGGPPYVNSTRRDFFGPGTQPLYIIDGIVPPQICAGCHGGYDEAQEPYTRWAASMMAQSARDPIFRAALTITQQDAPAIGDMCIRCHAPRGWLEGRSEPEDGSALDDDDLRGVQCSVCHRMVDPEYDPDSSPPEDQQILDELPDPTNGFHNAHMVVDRLDRRRGPYELEDFFYHDWLKSGFHRESNHCGTCHDVSNPLFTKSVDGGYDLNPMNRRHPTDSPRDMFPMERTYSEWTQSMFASGPVDMGGRFGGTLRSVSSCQDCHMPQTTGYGCEPFLGAPERADLKQHDFNGANTWVLRAVRTLYEDGLTGMTEQSMEASIARSHDMLRRASDLELTSLSGELNARIINYSGHKLPTGYIAGRRMWVNVRFLDENGGLVREFGAYDLGTATLDTASTKVYEARHGVDADLANLIGFPEGPTLHVDLANKIYLDNRIPPMGFTNAGFASVQAEPVAYPYADGQYWDDTRFPIPQGARSAEVRVMYQTTSREFIEFLRDKNITNNDGQIAYDQWVLHGKSAPVEMDLQTIDFVCTADFNGDGFLDSDDFFDFLNAFYAGENSADFNGDGLVDSDDFFDFLNAYFAGC